MYRKGTSADCKRVYELICELECKELPRDRFENIYEEQVKDERYYHLICELDGNVVGVLNLRFEEQLHHSERIAEVLEFSIDASYRNRGIGKEMFDEACRLAKEAGCFQIELATNQLRKDAHRFYERKGMNNFHYKFSMPFYGDGGRENAIGR